MRRSKSLPSKTVRKYRSVSQRRNVGHEDNDLKLSDEVKRLERILQQSQQAIQSTENDSNQDDRDNTEASSNPYQGILADDLVDSDAYGASNDDLLILPSKKKSKKKPSASVQLTPEELKQAKQVYKQTQRKLQQLKERKAQKERRSELYQKLQTHSITKEQRQLLQSSSKLGQTIGKREKLRNLLQKERAGLTLTPEEHDLLYQDRKPVDEDDFREKEQEQPEKSPNKLLNIESSTTENQQSFTSQNKSSATSADGKTSSKKKNKKKKRHASAEKNLASSAEDNESPSKKPKVDTVSDMDSEDIDSKSNSCGIEHMDKKDDQERDDNDSRQSDNMQSTNSSTAVTSQPTVSDPTPTESPKPALSFAAQMMQSLSSLKSSSETTAQKVAEERRQQAEEAKAQEEARMAQDLKHAKNYTPSASIELKTAAALGLPVQELKRRRKIQEVPNRPADVVEARYDLPVGAMEFEVMDTIRNNDVTIICGETGSGKSTQVPQFLYEAGLTLSKEQQTSNTGSTDTSSDDHYLIGITQPRRVAAVSTAKRVCYEMGEGDGQQITGKQKMGNLVAYQTRYETAGLGDNTHVKFMTDGILLQEIQSDLLLRKYSVVCIDEAHERNLNSDALIGLLSAAIPLRKKAAKEPGSNLVPLKLVIMSATLRVADFTENKRLFAATPPAVLKIPGRTYPVTIHHSKVTEVENYEEVAYKKICKIHRKLPQGGLLVFLTGKQEIVRMVRRLRRTFRSREERLSAGLDANDVQADDQNKASSFVRDMDDEEVDGELFNDEDLDNDNEDMDIDTEDKSDKPPTQAEDGSNIPEKAIVLPLYSMMPAEEQAKVFAPVPEGHRLIVVATNIAETSITIPDISYVVDTGRQKCRNYNAGTGVASYDIMWISKAAADQRAGRAGRTGPGHCYRLYSSSMYGRHMDAFALPEVMTRPLEDVVLAMKAMKITNVAEFPFPTPPGKDQLSAAVKLLANLGCIDTSRVEEDGGDGLITRLGAAVAKLPLGVRYGKMLLVSAEAGVLDYAIAMVAVLSESSPFVVHGQSLDAQDDEAKGDSDDDESDEEVQRKDMEKKKGKKNKWVHRGGDILAGMLAVGAYTYAGRDAGGASEKMACRKFCEENGLHPVVMARIQKMRVHLARLAKARMSSAEGVAARTGGILSTMKPPNKAQEQLLCQAIASGLLDNVAMLAPLGSLSGEYSFSLRSAYMSCCSNLKEPLLMDRNSVVFSRDPRQLPKWICYDSIIRKTTKDGTPVATLKNITPIDCAWLGTLAKGSRLLTLGGPQPTPSPSYDTEEDVVLCSVKTKYGNHGWEIPSVQTEMYTVLQSAEAKSSSHFVSDDSFRWFARFLLEGRVFEEIKDLSWNDNPTLVTRRTPSAKVALLVSALASAGIDSAAALRKHWAEKDTKFLYAAIQKWVPPDSTEHVKSVWISMVKKQVKIWKGTKRRSN